MIRAVVLSLFLVGCASTQQITIDPPLYKYRANMQISVDGQTFDGMGVASQGTKDISIVSQAALDLLRITTCHRDFTVEKVDQGWFGGSGKKYTYHFQPTEKEMNSVCPMYIQAISKESVTDWGYLAFRTDEKMQATMDCNGTQTRNWGISVCQTKSGLDQIIRFDQPVKFAAEPECHVTQTTPQEFVVRGTDGFCLAEFTDGKIWHRLILLGYQSVLIRGQ